MTENAVSLNRLDTEFITQVEHVSGENLSYCYQCGKCTAGCPIAHTVTDTPNRIIRMAQLGLKQRALSSSTIWLCLSCVTCTARCPKGVDLARIMDALRELALAEGHARKAPNARLFEELFLDSILQYGRLYELGAIGRYNLQSGQPFHDLELALPLFKRGKLSFQPHKIKNIDQIRQIFKLYR